MLLRFQSVDISTQPLYAFESVFKIDCKTYTLVQVNGVFTSDDVRDGASLLLSSGHCCIGCVMVCRRIWANGGKGKKRSKFPEREGRR